MSSRNMANNRKVLISNLPHDITSNEIIQELFKSQNFKFSNINFDGSSAIVTLSDANEARRAAKLINGQLFKGQRISVIEAPPPMKTQKTSTSSSGASLVLVGNLSFDFTEDQFRDLMSPLGDIKNLFLVRGKISKKSKGYGFVEYKQRESAVRAKEHFMKTDAKYVEGRVIRVETVLPSLLVGEAKHSRTLFVDKLPKSFDDEEQLVNLFNSAGTVTFCKIPRAKAGYPRGYALVDYANVVQAEKGQEQLDGAQIDDSNIRISFCTPGKTAQDIFAKNDDQNNRQFGGHAMVGPRGPRIPNLLGANPLMAAQPVSLHIPFGIGGMPRMPRPHLPMEMMGSPGVPFLGQPLIEAPGPRFGPALRVPGSQAAQPIRAPRIRTPGIQTMRPRTQGGKGVNKIRPNNKIIKPKTTPAAKTPIKGNEVTSKMKEEVNKGEESPVKKQAKNDNEQDRTKTKETENEVLEATDEPSKPKEIAKEIAKEPLKAKQAANNTTKGKETANNTTKGKETANEQHKLEEKPKIPTPDPLAALQKIGESAVAAAMSQSSAEGGQVKVLQPVVFVDSDHFKQFQQFQELMKIQKEAQKSGDLMALSLEDLVAAAKGLKKESAENQKPKSEAVTPKAPVESKPPQVPQKVPQKQEVSKQIPFLSESSNSVAAKPSLVANKPSPASTKPSPVPTKPSPVPTKPSTKPASSASTKPSPVTTKPSPVPTKPSLASTKPSPASTKPSPASSNQSPASSKPSPASTKPSPASTKPSPASTKPSPASTKSSSVSPRPSPVSTRPSTMKPATIKLSPSIANSSSIPARHSPVVAKPSPVSTKTNLTPKSSPATTKPSSAPAIRSQSKHERPVHRQEKSITTTSTRNSYQRPSQHQQRSQAEEQKSTKSGSYERDRKSYDRNSYHDSKPTNTVSRTDVSSSSTMPPPPMPVASLLKKIFGVKPENKQDYGSDQRTTSSQADSRSHYGSPYQSGGKSNSPVSDVSRGTPKSSQQFQYGHSQQYQSTDGRDYNRSPANERESPASQNSSRSRYTLPERLPQARGNDASSHTPPSRYERNPERDLVSYPRPRSDMPYKQDTPPARDIKPSYVSPQLREALEPRDPLPSRDMRSIRDAVVTRNLASLREILPPRDDSPHSRDTLPPQRDRSPRDYLPRDLPPRDLPPRDVSPRSFPPRDVPPRDMARSRDILPPRDLPSRDISRDIFPSRGMPPRDDRSARDLPQSYMREIQMQHEREPVPYNKDSPSRYQTSPAATREALDRARFERALAGARDARIDYPAHAREPDNRYGRDLPTRESAMGTIRGPPARYPMDGPQNKRPRY